MSDDLYQQAILQKAKTPAHAGRLTAPDVSVTVDNPLCGDRITLDVKFREQTITDVGHQVRGCALCQASASVMASAVVGQTTNAALAAQDKIKAMLGGGDVPPAPWGEMAIFTPVRRHKSRHDCVVLPFDALSQAIAQAKTP